MKKKMPTTAEAEKWLTPDTFVVKGKIYIVAINGQVSLKDKEARK